MGAVKDLAPKTNGDFGECTAGAFTTQVHRPAGDHQPLGQGIGSCSGVGQYESYGH